MYNWFKFLTHENELLREACKQALSTGNDPLIVEDLILKNITELPHNLQVKKSLWLVKAYISTWNGLCVKKDLTLIDSEINDFEDKLIVHGEIKLRGVFLHKPLKPPV